MVLAAASCGGLKANVRLTGGDDVFKVSGVGVYPVVLKWDAPAYLSYERAMTIVGEALATERLVVLGPTEFTIEELESQDVLNHSTLPAALAAHGVPPAEQLALRAWAEQRVQSQAHELYDPSGRKAGLARDEQATLVVHLEVILPAARRVLATLEATREVDLFADRAASDPLPELTETVRALTKKAFDALGPRLAMPEKSRREAGFTFATSDRPGIDFTLQARPPFSATLAKLDLLDRDVARLERYHALDPEATNRRCNVYDAQPYGLYIVHAEAPAAAAGLRDGDLVTAVDGEPALGPQVVARRLRADGAAMKLTVARGKDTAEVLAPLP